MRTLAKVGYILIGLGIGVIGTSIVYERRLKKCIEVEEEFVPEGGWDEEESDDDISEDDDPDEESDMPFMPANPAKDILKEHAKTPVQNNMTTPYWDMYRGNDPDGRDNPKNGDSSKKEGEQTVREEPTLDDLNKAYLDYITKSPTDEDVDPAGIPDDIGDEDLNMEIVEPNIGVYIGDIPSDYIELRWYNNDWTLADERDIVVPNASEVVGMSAIHRLVGRGPGAEDGVIYVKNLKTHLNYEIVFTNESYSETVLGIFESRRNEAKRNGSGQ